MNPFLVSLFPSEKFFVLYLKFKYHWRSDPVINVFQLSSWPYKDIKKKFLKSVDLHVSLSTLSSFTSNARKDKPIFLVMAKASPLASFSPTFFVWT